ncbi:anthranilate synthase component I [Lentisphaerota bacterium ZTH]|nr:anthranilate synthase component I [Lentisphaerota bacterium]WET05396.1 anthranilate synthase component I [Lentisphaerota bacterium ZTH]
MLKPDFKEFSELAKEYNLIPVCREHLADLETPVSVLSRFAEDENVFLLESVEGGERFGRYSFIGVDPDAVLTIEKQQAVLKNLKDNTSRTVDVNKPHEAIRAIIGSYKPAPLPGVPGFSGGLVGRLGYNLVREFEKLPEIKQPPNCTACLMLCKKLIIFDNVKHTLRIVVSAEPETATSPREAYNLACQEIEAIEKRLRQPVPDFENIHNSGESSEIVSNVTQEEYIKMVKQAKEYITRGDVIQVVISQRFSRQLKSHPLQLYRALRLINPSPYMFYIKFDGKVLVGSSPEVMVRKTGNKAILRPIAGTRPRGCNEVEDRRLADELMKDEKERAEHLMLVDLGRNDLGRIAAPSSVHVKQFMTVERYSHVLHLTSEIEAEMQPGEDAISTLKAAFPAGTLSGAPKVRAMEIIEELEPESRDSYGGAVGYFSFNGDMDTAITIRTFEIDDNRVSVQAGAGIVYDSDPVKEFEETKHKASALFRAMEYAANGLNI